MDLAVFRGLPIATEKPSAATHAAMTKTAGIGRSVMIPMLGASPPRFRNESRLVIGADRDEQ